MTEEKRDKLQLEAYLLILVFLFLPLDSLFSGSRLGQDITPSKLFVFLTVLVFLFRSLLTKDLTRALIPLRNPFIILFILYLLISMVSILNSRFATEAVIQNPYFLLFRRASFLIFCCVIIVGTYDFRAFRYIVSAVLIASVLSCLTGVYEIVTNKPFLSGSSRVAATELMSTPTGAVRISGLELFPGIQAVLLVMLLPFLLQALFTAERKIVKLIIFILVLLYLVNIVGNGSRTGWIGMLIAVSVFLFFSLKGMQKLLYLGGGLISILLIFIMLSLFTNLATTERITGEGQSGQASIQNRLARWEMASRMVRDYPVMGIGTGNFLNAQYHYAPDMPLVPNHVDTPMDPHCAYFQILAENGLAGIILFALLLLSVLREILFSIWKAPSRNFQLMAYACLASFAASLWLMALEPILDAKYLWAIMSLSITLSCVARFTDGGNLHPSHT